MCTHEQGLHTNAHTHSFVRNKHDSQSKKTDPTEIFTPSIIMAEVSRREEKIHLVQHAATQCGQMFVLADQKRMSLLYLTVSARSISYWLQSSVRKCVLNYKADLCKIGPWCPACWRTYCMCPAKINWQWRGNHITHTVNLLDLA